MKITKQTIFEEIRKDIADDLDKVQEHNKIVEILKPLEGKPLTGNVLNKKRLNGYECEWKYGMCHIKGKYSHLIGYDSTNAISLEKFEEWDACNGYAAQQRADTNNRLINDDAERIEKLFSAVEKHYEGLKEAIKAIENEELDSFHFPAHYNLLRLIQPTEKEREEINLSNFKYSD